MVMASPGKKIAGRFSWTADGLLRLTAAPIQVAIHYFQSRPGSFELELFSRYFGRIVATQLSDGNSQQRSAPARTRARARGLRPAAEAAMGLIEN